MKLTELSSAEFKYVMKLLQEKEKLLAKVSTIDRELEAIEAGKGRKGKGHIPGVGGTGSGKRGKLKEAIIQELKAAGANGAELKALADKLQATSVQISTWFATTGKKIKEIQKLERGKYAWVALN